MYCHTFLMMLTVAQRRDDDKQPSDRPKNSVTSRERNKPSAVDACPAHSSGSSHLCVSKSVLSPQTSNDHFDDESPLDERSVVIDELSARNVTSHQTTPLIHVTYVGDQLVALNTHVTAERPAAGISSGANTRHRSEALCGGEPHAADVMRSNRSQSLFAWSSKQVDRLTSQLTSRAALRQSRAASEKTALELVSLLLPSTPKLKVNHKVEPCCSRPDVSVVSVPPSCNISAISIPPSCHVSAVTTTPTCDVSDAVFMSNSASQALLSETPEKRRGDDVMIESLNDTRLCSTLSPVSLVDASPDGAQNASSGSLCSDAFADGSMTIDRNVFTISKFREHSVASSGSWGETWF